MSTVAQVINRLYREYLTPPSNRPTMARLNGALTDSATTVPHQVDGLLTPEEQDLLGEGTTIEINSELMLVTAYSAPNFTVIRAQQGTSAAAHSDNDTIYIAPPFTRLAVFDAVCDAIVDLYPDLYAVKTKPYTSVSDWEAIDATAVFVHKYRYLYGSKWMEGIVELLTDFPPSGTNVAIQFDGRIPSGKDGYLTFFSKFPRPTAETDNLSSTTGTTTWVIPEEWVKIILIDAMASLMAVVPIERVNIDFITELLENEGFSVKDAVSIRNAMILLRNEWVDRAAKRLRTQYPITTTMRTP